MIHLRDIKRLMWMAPDPKTGEIRARQVGKFYDDGRTVAVIADHHGLLRKLPHEGPRTPEVAEVIRRLNGHYTHVVPVGENDPEPQPPPSEPEPKAARPPPIFDYRGPGMDHAHRLEFRDGGLHFDNQALSDRESQMIMGDLKTGKASLQYAQLAKAEGDMASAAPSLSDSMNHMRELVAAGHLPQEHYDRVRRELFEDEMVPGIGNKRAFLAYTQSHPTGPSAVLDGNSIKAINDLYGHDMGDKSIVLMGQALKSAAQKAGVADSVKIHRMGGDEFHVGAEQPEHLHMLLRNLRTELEAHPPLGGTHPLSMSAGIGDSHLSADKALYGAKGQKKEAIKAAGGDPESRMAPSRHALYVHSAFPGQEGPVPISEPHPLHPGSHASAVPAAPSPSPTIPPPQTEP